MKKLMSKLTKKLLLILLVTAIALQSAGCWDRQDIEDRAYILGVSIDSYPPFPEYEAHEKSESSPGEEIPLAGTDMHTGEAKYAFAIQLPIIARASQGPVGQTGKGGEGRRTWELTQIGNSFVEMTADLSSRLSLVPYYGHLQAIVISDSVAREGLRKVLDFFRRDPEMRRRTKIFICEGNANKILYTIPKIEDYSSLYLFRIPTLNSTTTGRIVRFTDLGDTLENINSDLPFVLPSVKSSKDQIKLTGGTVFKEDKMVGLVDSNELEHIKLIRSLFPGGVFTASCPVNPNAIIALRVQKATSKTTADVSGKVPKFTINISVTGNYAENVNIDLGKTIDKKYLTDSSKALSDKIQSDCMSVVKRMQEEYKADIFQFWKVLKTRKPAYWETVKDNWEEVFASSEVDIHVKVNIRQIGNTR